MFFYSLPARRVCHADAGSIVFQTLLFTSSSGDENEVVGVIVKWYRPALWNLEKWVSCIK